MGEDASRKNHLYGGQALIEGVMMRGRDHWAVAVRKPAHDIHLESHEIDSIAKRVPLLGKPGFRGVIALGQALAIGFKALSISANEAQPEDEKLSSAQMGFSMILAVGVFIGLFIVLPALGFGYAERHWLPSGLLANVLEGVFRVLLLLGYLVLIGRMKEVRRVFQYHGAEHKTIHNLESGLDLSPENAQTFSRFHPRCGTSFLFLVVIVSFVVFAFLGRPDTWQARVLRFALIPVIAGISFEIIRFAGAHYDKPWVRWMSEPGLRLQRLTTREPSKDMLEVAIAALRAVL